MVVMEVWGIKFVYVRRENDYCRLFIGNERKFMFLLFKVFLFFFL